MRITAERLRNNDPRAGESQVRLFEQIYPNGIEPTLNNLTNLTTAVAIGLDVWWTCNLLPLEGPGSRQAYALWCVERVVHLCRDPRLIECLAIVRRRVADPGSVSDEELATVDKAVSKVVTKVAASASAWAVARAVGGTLWASLTVEFVADIAANAVLWAATTAAAGIAARAAEREAQLAHLSQLLLEAE